MSLTIALAIVAALLHRLAYLVYNLRAKMSLTIALAVVAALLHGFAYLLYNFRAKRRPEADPNATTWFLWAFLAILNAASYNAMSDWVAALQMFTGSLACTATFVYLLIIGKLKKMARGEMYYLLSGLAAAIVWWIFRRAELANLIVGGAITISFVPLLKDVMERPHIETRLPWFIWTAAWGTTVFNNAFLKHVESVALVTPILMVVAHALMGLLATRARQSKLVLTQGPAI